MMTLRTTPRWLGSTVIVIAALPLAPLTVQAQICQHNTQVGCVRAGSTCSPVTKGGGATGRCVTTPGLPRGERECECAGTPTPPPPPFDPRCSDPTASGKIICRIDRPEVKKAEQSYPVVFVANDVVEVSADGCVQTGGRGKTWKRYVNPSGRNSTRLYHGRVRIPTATREWERESVRINSVVAQQLTVTGKDVAGREVAPSQLVLSLGYEDDGYSDNGYHDHDDGTEDQCKSDPFRGVDGGPAHVTITIYRKVKADPPSSRFDFDVVSSARDKNGLALNPMWSWQGRPQNAGQVPSTALCHHFSARGSTAGIPDMFMSPSFADCTAQADASTVDVPSGWPNEPLCNFWTVPYTGNTFAGHVNWFPVTFEGRARWGDHGNDDDYTFEFYAEGNPAQANPLSVNGRDGMHAEFDSDETIDHFTSDAWEELHWAVDNDEARAEMLFNGHTIITGMFGLDSEHSMKAELHPVFALATRRDAVGNDPSDEVWLMFVRNLGNEGYCSSKIWYAGFEDYTFQLPWREGMTSVDVDLGKTQFYGTDGTSVPVVSVVLPDPTAPEPPQPAVFVTFHLGPPQYNSQVFGTGASVPFVNGALHLVWRGPPRPGARPSADVRAGGEERGAESAIAAATRALPPEQRARVGNARKLPETRPARVSRLGPMAPVRIIADSATIGRTTTPRAVSAGPAKRRQARDAAMMKELCALTGNAPVGLPPVACAGTTPRPRQP